MKVPSKRKAPVRNGSAARRGSKTTHTPADARGEILGPSTNPATNLIIAGVAMRGAAILLRRSMEKGLLRGKFNPQQASQIVKGRTMGATLVSAAMSRVALGSVPGFVLVSGGLLAKTMFDRSMSKQKARREGEQALLEQAENASE